MIHADIILEGGPIFLGFEDGMAEALAIGGGRVLGAGTRAAMLGLQGSRTQVIDLAGRSAVPGFNDAHMHLVPLGLSMLELDLRIGPSLDRIDGLLELVEKKARTARAGEWILGRGYDQNELADLRHPTLSELDRAAPDNPVLLKRACGHVGVANSMAFLLAGITEETSSPPGGLIERRDGRLTGLVAEGGLRLLDNALPALGPDQLRDAIQRAGRLMIAQGITSTMDAAIGMTAGMEELRAFEHLARNGELPLRVWACLYGDPEGIGQAAFEQGFRFGREVGLLRYGAMKIFADGSVGGMTAAMTQPYLAGDGEVRGILRLTDGEMHDLIGTYHRMGYQLAVHAIGDEAIDQVIAGIRKAGDADGGTRGRRHRIEHCGFVRDDQIAEMAELAIEPVPQPVFLHDYGDAYVVNLGRERTVRSHPIDRWRAAGMRPSASTDAPICATNPLRNLHAMMTRQSARGEVLGRESRQSIRQSIRAYTEYSAYTQFHEDVIGRLVPGYRADIAVLSADIFTASPLEIRDGFACDMTILEGRIVHDRLNQARP